MGRQLKLVQIIEEPRKDTRCLCSLRNDGIRDQSCNLTQTFMSALIDFVHGYSSKIASSVPVLELAIVGRSVDMVRSFTSMTGLVEGLMRSPFIVDRLS